MNIPKDIQDLKNKIKRLGCPEIFLSDDGIGVGTEVNGCYRMAVDFYGRIFYNVDGFWQETFSGSGGGDPDNALLSGGIVSWVEDYTYMITPATYLIEGVQYSSTFTTISLADADPLLDRFDLFVLNTAGEVEVITGEPLSDPLTPGYDSTTQLPIGTVLVTHNTTQPTVLQEYLYRENIAPWTASSSAPTHIDVNSISAPLVGIKSIYGTTNMVSGDYIEFTDTAKNLRGMGYNVLILKVKAVGIWQPDSKLIFQWYNGSPISLPTGQAVTVRDGSYNFDGGNVTDIQTITIPLSAFAMPNTTNKLRITANFTSFAFSFKLDDIQVQKSLVPFIGNFWYAQGDNIFNNNTGGVSINGIVFSPGRTIGGSGKLTLLSNSQADTSWRFANAVSGLNPGIALVTNETGGSISGAYAKGHEWFGDFSQKTMAVYNEGFVSIGPSTTPSKHAELDINSIGRGLLIPRMTTTQRNGIGRRLLTIPVTNGGSGYVLPPAITVQNTGGLIARARATVAGGAVTSVVVDYGGSLYLVAPTITINNVGTGGFIGNVAQPDGSGLVLGTPTVTTDTPPTSMLIYNTTTSTFQYYNGASWVDLTGGGGTGLIGTTTGNDTTDPIILNSLVDGANLYYLTDGAGQFPQHVFAANSGVIGGGNIVAIGYEAALNNSGDGVNAIGTTAAQNNTGLHVNAIGTNSAKDNGGSNIISIGSDATSGNIGDNINALGRNASDGNQGSNVNSFGNRSGIGNTGDDVNIFGDHSAGTTDNNSFNNINLFGPNAQASGNRQTVFNNGVANLIFDQSAITADRVQTNSDADGNLFVGYKGNYTDPSALAVSSVGITLPVVVPTTTYFVTITAKNATTAPGRIFVDNQTTGAFTVNFTSAITGAIDFDWCILI